MSFETKLNNAHKELKAAGFWESNYRPPIYRLLRRLGVKVRPPHYSKFIVNFLGSSLFFSIAWGIFMWHTNWSSQDITYFAAALRSIITGIVFGLIMSLNYRHGARKHKLRTWDEI